MPELPEVETVVRSLRPYLQKKIIKKIEIYTPKLRQFIPCTLNEQIGHMIDEVTRSAKYIIISTSAPEEIIVHLGMTGNLLIKDQLSFQRTKHDHLAIYLDNGTVLIYHDPRKFGLITTTSHAPKSLDEAAIDAVSDDFTAFYLNQFLKIFPKTPIKLALMNNKIVSGIGNIYANESLFMAKILPTRQSSTLSQQELDLLVRKIKEVLFKAIDAGGSSIKDHKSASGESGYFQQQLLVYGRDRKPCKLCTTLLKRTIISGRSTFFCSQCQR